MFWILRNDNRKLEEIMQILTLCDPQISTVQLAVFQGFIRCFKLHDNASQLAS